MPLQDAPRTCLERFLSPEGRCCDVRKGPTMRFVDTADVSCPACRSLVPFLCRDEDASHSIHSARAGDIVCTACGAAVVFSGSRTARLLTPAEEARLPDEARRILDEAQGAAR